MSLANFYGHFSYCIKRAFKNIRDAWKIKCEVCENQNSSTSPCLPVLKAIQVSWWIATDLSLLAGAAKLFSGIFFLFSCQTAWRYNDTGLNICIVFFKVTMKSYLFGEPAQLRRLINRLLLSGFWNEIIPCHEKIFISSRWGKPSCSLWKLFPL